MICTFIGHRSVTENISQSLHEVLIELIETYDINVFYVGNQGQFDMIVRGELKKLKARYPHIICCDILAYMPPGNTKSAMSEFMELLYPDVLETTPPKFAISKRNHWMIEHSDFVITYVKKPFGNAAKFKQLAESKGKKIINLAEINATFIYP